MFSEQAGRLEELRGVLPEQALQVLREIIGNPTQPLKHHGPVEFAGPTPEGAEDSGAIFVDTRYEALIRGKLLGSVEYAKAVDDYRIVYNTRVGIDEYWIECRKVSKHTGEGIDGPSFDVLLLATGGNLPDVDNGDVIAYLWDEHKVRLGLFCCTCTAAAASSSEGSEVGPSVGPSESAASVSVSAAECLTLTVDGINQNTAAEEACGECHTLNGGYGLNFYHTVEEVAWTSHFWYSCPIPTECSATGIVRFYAHLHPHLTGGGLWGGVEYWLDVYLCDGTDDPEGEAGFPWTSSGKNVWIHWEGRQGPAYTSYFVTWDDLVAGNIGLVAAGWSGSCDIPLAVVTGNIGVGECPDCGSSISSSSSPPSSSPSSGSPSSESEPPSVSSEAECNYTGSTVVGKGDLHRSGDYVYETMETHTFENGHLCSITPAGESEVYICCPETSSSSDASSEDGGSV